MLANPYTSSFLDTNSLSTSSLGCRALCISFLVYLSIFVSPCLVHFTKGLEYLTKETAQVFVPLIRFLLESFISSSFLILWRYSFLILSFIFNCLMVAALKMPKNLLVSFSPSVLILSWLGTSIPIVRCCFPLFIISWHIFLCQIPFLCRHCIFPQHILEFPILFHFFANSWM